MMPYKDELIVSISFDIEFHSFEEFCIVRDDTLIKGKYVLCIKLVWQINVCSENHILSPSIYFLIIFNSRIQKKIFFKVLHLNDQLSFKYFYASITIREVFVKDSDL